MSQYGKADYWELRYEKNPTPYDWYQPYENFRNLIKERVEYRDNILVVGCGNSQMSLKLFDDGYKNQVNIDHSACVIRQMTSLCSKNEKYEKI